MNRAKVRSGTFQGSKKARLNGSGAITLDWKQKNVFLFSGLCVLTH
jgi:hypothetical protein